MPDSYWPSSNALSTRAACLVVSSLSPEYGGDIVCGGEAGGSDESDRVDEMPRTKDKRALRHKTAVGRPSLGLSSSSSSNLVTITTQHKRAGQGRILSRAHMQRITRLMSSPLLFHNRQFIMATAGDSVDKPIEQAIRSKVLCHVIKLPSP